MDIYSTSTVSLYLNIDVATRIRQISKVLHVTPFQFYLSALQVFLYRLMGISDQCIGIIDANRSDLNFASTLGYLINTLPLRFEVDGSLRFNDVITRTHKNVHLAMANSNLPFGILLDELKVPRSAAHSPLF